MTVTLTSDQGKFIQEHISLGRYASAEQLVADGLLLVQGEEFINQNVEVLRQQLDIGLAQLDRSESKSASEVFSRLEQRIITPPQITGY